MARITKAELQEQIKGLDGTVETLSKWVAEKKEARARAARALETVRNALSDTNGFLADEQVKSAGLAFENAQLHAIISKQGTDIVAKDEANTALAARVVELEQGLQHKSIQLDASRDTLKRTRAELAEWRESSHKWRALWLDLDSKRLALVNASDDLRQSQGLTVVRRFAQFIAG